MQIIPNVWWVDFGGTATELRNWMQRIADADDLLVVIEAKNAAWTGILVDSDIFAHLGPGLPEQRRFACTPWV